jgi:hypothetical protein
MKNLQILYFLLTNSLIFPFSKINKEKFLKGTMFDIECLNHFYDIKKEPDTEVSDEIKEAYFEFLNDFCKYVSTFWSGYIKKDRVKHIKIESLTFQANLTISDEAICMWLIKLNYKTAYDNSIDIQRIGKKNWMKEREKGKSGQHDTKIHYVEYKTIFNKIKKGRKDIETYIYWQKVFFEALFHSYEYVPAAPTSVQNEDDDDNDSTYESEDVIEL